MIWFFTIKRLECKKNGVYMLKKEDYEYFMSPNYNVLKKEDIDKYDIKAYSASHFNIYYICDNSIFFSVSDSTFQIIHKFTENDVQEKISFYDLPSEVSYNFNGNPLSIIYRDANRKGQPDQIKINYSTNNQVTYIRYFWHNNLGICVNDQLNLFFNNFFTEKIFDITTDYEQNELIDLIIEFFLNGKTSSLEIIFSELNIKSLDHINHEYSKIINLLQY